MRDWPAVPAGEIPSPRLVAAWTRLGLTPPERIPLWAAHWLADGHDGTALRTLAGLSGADAAEVREVLPAALADCGVAVPDSDGAAGRTVLTHIARVHAAGLVDEKWVVERLSVVVGYSGYDPDVVRLPLGQLFDLTDEWGSDWGRSERELVDVVRRACAEQLALTERS